MYNEILDVELGPNVLHNFFLSLNHNQFHLLTVHE